MSQASRQAYDAWHDRLEVDGDVDTPWHRLLFAHLDGARDPAGRRVLEIACDRGGLSSRTSRSNISNGLGWHVTSVSAF